MLFCIYIDTHSYIKKCQEITIQEGIRGMVRYGGTVCAADAQMYKLLQLGGGSDSEIPLFPYDSSVSVPIMVSIGEMEFLIVSSGGGSEKGLGVFVSRLGEPTRATLEWPSYPISVGIPFYFNLASLLFNILQSIFTSICHCSPRISRPPHSPLRNT